jgi:O-antigen ligase
MESEGAMYEVFPLVAGVIIGLLGPRFVSASQRKGIYGALGVVVAALATILAGEEWFFIFIDLAFVFGAMAVTTYLLETWPKRRTTRLP